MEPSLSVTSRAGEVSIKPADLRWVLGVTFPFYALRSNECHPDSVGIVVDALIDGEAVKCDIVAIVGDSEEPIMVIFRRIYDKRLDTFVAFDWKEGLNNGEFYTAGKLEARQMIYTIPGFERDVVPYVREIIRQLM